VEERAARLPLPHVKRLLPCIAEGHRRSGAPTRSAAAVIAHGKPPGRFVPRMAGRALNAVAACRRRPLASAVHRRRRCMSPPPAPFEEPA